MANLILWIGLWIWHVLHYTLRPLFNYVDLKSKNNHPKTNFNWILNTVFIGPCVMFPVIYKLDTFYRGIVCSFIEIIVLYVIYSVLFFAIHVLFHSRWMYKWHKYHHSYIQITHPWSAFDATWIEHAFINVFPLAFGCLIMNTSQSVCILFVIVGTENSMMAHTGKSTFHSLHHLYRNVNYGVDPICDKLFKTIRYE